jgi:hypothetical protein
MYKERVHGVVLLKLTIYPRVPKALSTTTVALQGLVEFVIN